MKVPIRAITGTQAACDALRTRVDAALGLPRCERLAGNLTLDGSPILPSDTRLSCPCTRADTPDARCKFATRAESLPIELVSGWCYPVTESKPEVLAALTAPERAAVVDVADSQIKPRP